MAEPGPRPKQLLQLSRDASAIPIIERTDGSRNTNQSSVSVRSQHLRCDQSEISTRVTGCFCKLTKSIERNTKVGRESEYIQIDSRELAREICRFRTEIEKRAERQNAVCCNNTNERQCQHGSNYTTSRADGAVQRTVITEDVFSLRIKWSGGVE